METNCYWPESDGTEPRKLVSVTGPRLLSRVVTCGKQTEIYRDRRQDQWRIHSGKSRSQGTNLHPLFPGWHNPPDECCGKWTADGKYFVFESQGQIWELPEEGRSLHQSTGKPIQLTSSPLGLFTPLPSKDGKKLFVVGRTYRGELERGDPKSGQFTPFLSGISAEVVVFPKTANGWPMSPTLKASSGEANWTAVRGDSSAPLRCLRGCRAGRPTANRLYSSMPHSANPQRSIWFQPTGAAPSNCCPKIPNLSRIRTGRRTGKRLSSVAARLTIIPAIRVLDLNTHKVSTLPGSRGLFAPCWSPDGRYIVAMPWDSLSLVLFDFQTQKWSQLANVRAAFMNWSRDGQYVYFLRLAGQSGGAENSDQ